ncbi:MAG TPA: hypothetical protein VFU24_03955, partial [Burkholderiales bacterium]|nr:hypothetical protein [Burkholderiales bacterium]
MAASRKESRATHRKGGGVPSYIKLVSGLFSIVLLLLASPPAGAIDLWQYGTGQPKFLDANEACVSSLAVLEPFPCNANPRNVRAESYGNPNPSMAECLFDTTCTCSSCGIAGTYPNGGNTLIHYGGSVLKYAQSCPAGTIAFLGLCVVDTPKGKGPCPD